MKIRTDFVTNSSSSNYIIDKALIRESPASLVSFERRQNEVLSTLCKVWTDSSTLDPKLAYNRYTVFDLAYQFCQENKLNPIAESTNAATETEGAFLSKLRRFIESDGSKLIVLESEYSSAAHMEESVIRQLNYLWPHLEDICLIPCLSEAIKQVYDSTTLRS